MFNDKCAVKNFKQTRCYAMQKQWIRHLVILQPPVAKLGGSIAWVNPC